MVGITFKFYIYLYYRLYIVSYVGYMDDKLEDVFEDFLGKVGVIDLVTKLYKNLHKNNPQLAKTWFLEHRLVL